MALVDRALQALRLTAAKALAESKTIPSGIVSSSF